MNLEEEMLEGKEQVKSKRELALQKAIHKAKEDNLRIAEANARKSFERGEPLIDEAIRKRFVATIMGILEGGNNEPVSK